MLYYLRTDDKLVTGVQCFNTDIAGTTYVGVAFKLTHAAGSDMDSDADYAIAADFCNFDQNNGSLVHNCMYRLEAVETGETLVSSRAL